MRRAAALGALLVLAAWGAGAQPAPRATPFALSGTWVMDTARTTAGPTPRPLRMTRQIRFVPNGVEMAVTQPGPRGDTTVVFRCPIDGSECRNAVPGGNTTTSTARFDRGAFVVTTRLTRLLVTMVETEDRYAVVGDDLVVERTYTRPAPGSQRLVFRKAPR